MGFPMLSSWTVAETKLAVPTATACAATTVLLYSPAFKIRLPTSPIGLLSGLRGLPTREGLKLSAAGRVSPPGGVVVKVAEFDRTVVILVTLMGVPSLRLRISH